MTTTQNGNEGFMIPQIGIVKIIGGASLFAFAIAKTSPYVGEVINEASGVSLGVVGAVFMVSVTAIIWTLNERNAAKEREERIKAKLQRQADGIALLTATTNDLIDGQRDIKMLMLKIGEHSGVPGCAGTLQNMKAIDHVRKPPSTL